TVTVCTRVVTAGSSVSGATIQGPSGAATRAQPLRTNAAPATTAAAAASGTPAVYARTSPIRATVHDVGRTTNHAASVATATSTRRTRGAVAAGRAMARPTTVANRRTDSTARAPPAPL